ncbi:glycosyl transferase [Planosporangium flavigriseum]|uniref:Glycosyl transferase n=2 Tax=Planosporangium flavigriseum TaxID=373681 RepID=A0A8J3PL76_9ACTN|nr:glycosyl transferase [Planosporangium flavigriseum]
MTQQSAGTIDGTAQAGTRDKPVADRRSRRRADALMVALALVGAAWLLGGLWVHPDRRAITINASDQALFEWLLAYAADTLRGGHNPLWTDLLNAPGGVNLAVNTAVTVLGWVLAPVTLLLGPSVTFTVALTFGVAATPVAWYLLLSRKLVRTPAAAIVGGLFCGFAPGLVSHANAHVNFASGYLVPLIIWRVLELRRPGRAVRNGLILGVLVAVQFSLGAETLFFAALACGVLLGFLLVAGYREPREHIVAFAKGLATTAVTAGVLLAYPIWMMFAGPGSYHGTGFNQVTHSEDLMAYGAFPRRSLAGVLGLAGRLAPNPTEENSFFGVPGLLLLIGAAVLALRLTRGAARRALARALVASALLFAVLSLGPVLKFNHHRTGVPLPYKLLQHAPLFDSALPGRFALIVTAIAGVLLALSLDRLPRLKHRRLVAAAVAMGLLPVVPAPLLTMDRSPVPHFISSGHWREYVRPGETLIPAPLPSDWLPDGQRWQAAVLAGGDGETFRVPAGFFLGPDSNGRGRIGPPPRWMQTMLSEAALRGDRPLAISPVMQAEARSDLQYWGGNVIVLPDGGYGNRWNRRHGLLLELLTELFGEPTRVDDVWLWQVR